MYLKYFEDSKNTNSKHQMFSIRQGYHNVKKNSPEEQKWKNRGFLFTYKYLAQATIHGFKQVTPLKRHWLEYCFWGICIILAVFQTINQSLISWYRYQNYPTVSSIERDHLSWNTSLAALVLCPKTKLDTRKLNLYVEGNFPETEWETTKEFLQALAKTQYRTMDELPLISVNIKPDKYAEIINELKFELKFQSQALSQREIIYKYTILETGICATFNSELSAYFSPELFFVNESVHPKAPFNVIQGNPFHGDLIRIIRNLNSEFQGQIFGPNDIPDSTTKEFWGKSRTFTDIALSTLTIAYSKDIRSLSLDQRKCRFREESNLTISNIYSYTLCRMDCRRQLAIKLCNCSPHFYRQAGTTKICDQTGLQCLGKHKDYLMRLRNSSNKKAPCYCIPTCEDTNYFVETISAPKWFAGTYLKYGIYNYPRTRVMREVIYGVPDLVVSIGGTAGLFLGCSVLSFVEVLYFFTIRLLCDLKNRRNNL